jgi:hypothetical protein
MRRLGYQVVDSIVNALAGLRDRPPSRRAGPAELAGLLHEPVPRAGGDPEQVLRQAVNDVLGPAMRVDHPRFFAYVPIPSNFVGMLADALASGFGVFAGTWQAASGAAAAELATLRWLRELFGLPETAGGLFVDGGSSANLYGLVAARRAVLEDRLEGAVLYASDQTHSWIGRAAGMLGLQPAQVRLLENDAQFRLPPATVAAAVAADRAAGRRPFCVVATSGTTSTGSVDPLAELAGCAGPRGCGSTSTAPSGPQPSLPPAGGSCWPGSSRPTRSPSTPTSGCSSRWRRAACWSATLACWSRSSRPRGSSCWTRPPASGRSTSPTAGSS